MEIEGITETLAQLLRRWVDIVQMLYKLFVFAELSGSSVGGAQYFLFNYC